MCGLSTIIGIETSNPIKVKKSMNTIKTILVSKQAKTFYWQTVNGMIILAISYFASIDWIYSAVMIAILNGATKFINTNYLS